LPPSGTAGISSASSTGALSLSDRPSLLSVSGLSVTFDTDRGPSTVVRGLDLTVAAGETVAIVGESGSGKSVTALAVTRLLDYAGGRISAGKVLFTLRDGGVRDLAAEPQEAMRRLRGPELAMVFQEPMTSLNPVLTVGEQIAEAVIIHQGKSRGAAWDHAVQMLHKVRIPDARKRAGDYPHQFSGGMRQRVMIAMALACHPQLLIADEPTTALDVTIQAQILKLIRELKEETGAAVMMITHDLGVVAEMCERVVVMYAGRKVEEAPVAEIFARPMHPYTRGLLGSVPKLGSSLVDGGRTKLAEIPGLVPSLRQKIVGCAFAGRCPMATELCSRVSPAIETKAPHHLVACHYAERRMAA
jgi:peptide/nickel transport system ATP-binding protein